MVGGHALRLLLFVFVLVAVLGELTFGWFIFQSYEKSKSLDVRCKVLQDITRQREIIGLRDLRQFVHPSLWAALQQKLPQDPAVRERIHQWIDTDLRIYKDVLKTDPSTNDYVKDLDHAFAKWMSVTDSVFDRLESLEWTADKKSKVLTDAEIGLLWRRYNNETARLESVLYDKRSGVADRFFFPAEYVQEWQRSNERLDDLLIGLLAFNTAIALFAACFLKWGPQKLLKDLNDYTSFFQKCLMLVWTPILFELIFIAVLASMFYHNNAELISGQKWFFLDKSTKALVDELIEMNGAVAPSASKRERIADLIQTLRLRTENRPQQIAALDEIEKALKSVYAFYPQFQDAAEKKNTDEQGRLQQIFVSDLTRAAIYAQYAKPEIGQQKLVQGRQEALKHEIEVSKNMEIGLALSILFNLALALLLNSYFNKSTSKRLDVITSNIGRLAERKPLLPELKGEDEFARLDNTFHQMSDLLLETIKKERSAIDNAGDVICSLEADLKIALVNPSCTSTWARPEDALIGHGLSEFVQSADRKTTTEKIELARKEGGISSFENRIEIPDGQILDMLWSVQWSEPEQQYFCVVQDITEKKQIERLKQEFIAMVSHDLRTPLTASTMFLELLEVGVYGELSEQGSQSLVSCTKEVQELIALIKDLLDIERLESGKIDFEFSAVSVEDIVDDAVDTLKPHIKSKNLKVEKNYGEDGLVGDQDRLTQAFISQLANAVNLAVNGSEIKIDATNIDDLIHFKISFTPEDPSVEFDDGVFEKYKKNRLKNPSGTGGTRLGLPLSMAIVHRHGGAVQAETKLEQGKPIFILSMIVPVTRKSPAQAVAIKIPVTA